MPSAICHTSGPLASGVQVPPDRPETLSTGWAIRPRPGNNIQHDQRIRLDAPPAHTILRGYIRRDPGQSKPTKDRITDLEIRDRLIKHRKWQRYYYTFSKHLQPVNLYLRHGLLAAVTSFARHDYGILAKPHSLLQASQDHLNAPAECPIQTPRIEQPQHAEIAARHDRIRALDRESS